MENIQANPTMHLPVLTRRELEELKRLIETREEHLFYERHKWKEISAYVRHKLDKDECQMHRARGRYARAELVHHVQHLKRRPELALSIYDENGQRQLVSLCKACHEECHPERRWRGGAHEAGFCNAERWD